MEEKTLRENPHLVRDFEVENLKFLNARVSIEGGWQERCKYFELLSAGYLDLQKSIFRSK